MIDALKDLLSDAATWVRRKVCRHAPPWNYEEVRLADGDRVSWSAINCCPKCGEVMAVEASFYGNKYRLAEAIEEEVSG